MKTMRDCFWLWGQNPGTHHMVDNGVENPFNLPGENKMTPLEGLQDLNIPNLCRVVFQGLPAKPYDQEMEQLQQVREMIWSIADYGNNGRVEDPDDDVREVIRQAQKYPNIAGVIMDDFFTNDYHFVKYSPDQIGGYREKIRREVPHPMDLWVVIYTRDFHLNIQPYLQHCDRITMWNWHGEELLRLDENLARLKSIAGPEKKYYAGCYVWDYGNARPLPRQWMETQLDTYYRWMKSGEIDGVIFCSNCVADLGIENYDLAKQWIAEHGDEILTEERE